jgi:5-methylcytosine-specific restriction endonuclease McrA
VLGKSRVTLARLLVESEREVHRVPETIPVEPLTPPVEGETATRDQIHAERRKLTTKLRWAVLQRDDFKCLKCGADAATSPSVRLDVDHIVPVARGGKTVAENLRTLCNLCNNGKGVSLTPPALRADDSVRGKIGPCQNDGRPLFRRRNDRRTAHFFSAKPMRYIWIAVLLVGCNSQPPPPMGREEYKRQTSLTDQQIDQQANDALAQQRRNYYIRQGYTNEALDKKLALDK